MKFAIWTTVVVSGCILLAGIAWANPDLARCSGCDFWNLPRWNAEVRQLEKSQEEIGIQSEVVLQRLQMKNMIVQALMAGEISSGEAISRFRVLDAGTEDHLRAVMAINPPVISDEELAYRNLVGFVRPCCLARPDGPQILAKLARDWEQERNQRVQRR
jgi:hypothetical protein